VAHRLGFAVKVLDRGGLPSHDTRRWQSGPHLRVSLERLEAIFDYLEQIEECEEELAGLGRRAVDAMGLGPEAVVVLRK